MRLHADAEGHARLNEVREGGARGLVHRRAQGGIACSLLFLRSMLHFSHTCYLSISRR